METQKNRFKNRADMLMPPAEGPILLHCCCAPCSTAILEWMAGHGLKPCVFFSNSNIVPQEEYNKRKEELVRYADHYGFEVVNDEYDHSAWLAHIKAGCAPDSPASLPERSKRCLSCFGFRLERAAEYAENHGFAVLTTTLASSRWKDLEQVDEAGRAACSSHPKVTWWGRNWRKGGLQERRSCLIREWKLYNQLYCGCEFSMLTGAAGAAPNTL
jgi:predicted adenine nucleotide alpha hydrolase (AANH) superfamily ATPase